MTVMRICLSEDEDLSAELLEKNLKPIITAFRVCKTMEETKVAVVEQDFDVLLLDLRLVDSDIPTTIASIQGLSRTGNVPVVVVTGMPDPSLELRCKEAGAAGFLPKMLAYSKEKNALNQAIYIAIMHHPKPRGAKFLETLQELQASLVKQSTEAS